MSTPSPGCGLTTNLSVPQNQARTSAAPSPNPKEEAATWQRAWSLDRHQAKGYSIRSRTTREPLGAVWQVDNADGSDGGCYPGVHRGRQREVFLKKEKARRSL